MVHDLYWQLVAVYMTGLVIEGIYTLCDKIGKAYIHLQPLTLFDWLELTFAPMVWPAMTLYKLVITLIDAKRALSIINEHDLDYDYDGGLEESWETT